MDFWKLKKKFKNCFLGDIPNDLHKIIDTTLNTIYNYNVLYILIKKLKKSKEKLFLSALFSLSIVYILNADSIIYLNYFFVIILI